MGRILLQQGDVWLRHIKRVEVGTPDAIDFLGQPMLAQPLEGLNGRFGFQEGFFEDEMGAPAPFQITFPNGAGSDGGQHSDRFLVLTGNPDGAEYRPGDEFIEIWRDSKLLYVGTPVPYDVGERLIIGGFNAMFLLNHARELDSGFWRPVGPRDLFEFYSQVWQDAGSDPFDPPADGSLRFAYSPSDQDTADGKFSYRNCRQDTDGSAWLAPGPGDGTHADGAAAGLLQTIATVPTGRQSAAVHGSVRAECTWSRSELTGDSASEAMFSFGLFEFGVGQVGFTELVDAAGKDRLYVGVSHDAAANFTLVDTRVDVEKNPIRMAVEVRQGWCYCWYNGKLVAVIPAPDLDLDCVAAAICQPGTGANRWMKIHQMVVWHTVPVLLSGAEKGDYHLPGRPAPGGLSAAFYNEVGLRAAVQGPAAVAAFPDYLLRPNLEPYHRDQHKAIDFWGIEGDADYPAWWPPGPPANADVSARWQGAVYLDAGTHSYGLKIVYGNRMRVWIGRTRIGETRTQDWDSGAVDQHAGVWPFAGPNVSPTPGAINKDGWYPIVVEWAKNPADFVDGASTPGVARLMLTRTDGVPVGTPHDERMWWNMGGSTYRLECSADAPVGFWPVDGVTHATAVETVFPDYSGNANHAAAYLTAPRGDSMSPGHKAARFNGTNCFVKVLHDAALDPGGSITMEALVLPEAVSGQRVILWKSNSYGLYLDAGVVKATLIIGGVGVTLTGPTLPTGIWTHVAFTWNATDGGYLFFVNGQPVSFGGSPGARTTGTADLYIGTHGAAFEWWWQGRLADVGVYGTVLPLARIAAHHAALSQVAVGETSPVGCYEGQVRGESHFEMVRLLHTEYGLQFGVEPRPLESPEFPGQSPPRVRKGRDVARSLDAAEASEYRAVGNAESVTDALSIDGAGLGDDSQLTIEILNHDELGKHFMIHQAVESLGEITLPENLIQRGRTLLDLNSRPWEEVSARPPGFSELAETFQLPAEIAEFGWESGDALFLDLDKIGVVDTVPRPIESVHWPFTPAGLQVPEIKWRQRRRARDETLRRIARYALVPKRNYQGQKVSINSPGVAAPTDTYLSLPENLATALAFLLKVDIKGTDTPQAVSVNGAVVNVTVNAVGTYELLPYLAAVPGTRLTHVSVANAGAELCFYSLELIKLV